MGRQRELNVGDPPHLHRKGDVWYHVTGTRPRKWTALGRNKPAAIQRCEAIEQQRLTAERLYWERIDEQLREIMAQVYLDPSHPGVSVPKLQALLRQVAKDGVVES
jgi:hypothetical protein